jgi:hypothetical protein
LIGKLIAMTLQPTVPKTKFKQSMRGVDIIQTVYALLIALGLREVFVAFHTIFLRQAVAYQSPNFVAALGLFLNIVLLSVRFFWVPRNFRRLYYVSEFCRAQGKDAVVLRAVETSVHVMVILAHGALHFLLCKQFEYFVFVATTYDALATSAFTTYVYIHASLLVLNSLWLIIVNIREDQILDAAGHPPALKSNSESRLWYRSNLAFALLAVAPLVVFSSCTSGFSECISVSYSKLQGSLNVIPTSAYNVAAVFKYIAESIPGEHDPSLILALWVLVVLAANSLLDLTLTAHYYVILEDMETEWVYDQRGREPEA